MKVLLIGNGAREHAIAAALAESPSEPELYAYVTAKNPGIVRITKGYGVGNICDPQKVLQYAKEKKINVAVVGPEAPLEAGVVDKLLENDILCVGPQKSAAQIETDKSFCRNLLSKHRIAGNPKHGVFTNPKEAAEFIDSIGCDVAVKPVGLTGGKGVRIMGEHLKDAEDAKYYTWEVIESKIGGAPKVVVEEKLVGEEFTLQAFVDGSTVVGTPMVQDHKRAYDGDIGPNTGGMGSYSAAGYVLPFLTKKDYEQGIKIMEDTVKAIKKELGVGYHGFLYGQFMVTKDGPKIIEYNARLGDPEAMNILSILESDFMEVCERIVSGTLKNNLGFAKKATVCKYLAPEGYPEDPKTNVTVKVDEKKIKSIGGRLYYASVREEGGVIYTSSSRAIGVVGIADTITEAEVIAEKSVGCIRGELFHRKDIGTQPLVQKRIDHMKEVRG